MDIKAAFSSYSCDNVDACKQFYGETLGLSLEEKMGGIGLSINGQRTFIYPKNDHKPAAFTVLNFIVDDINAAVDTLTAKGVTFERYDDMPGEQDERAIMRGKAAGMGPDIAWFKDPVGNILALIEDE